MVATNTIRDDVRGQRPKRRLRQRRGSLYIAVLGVTIIVAMMSLTTMHVVRTNFRSSTGKGERYEAAILASSAVENALTVLRDDPNWRTNLTSGQEYPATPVALGNGTFAWKLVDDDGNLSDDESDTVLIQGIGRVDEKIHIEQVCVAPTGDGMTCLEASLHSQAGISTYAWIETNQMVSSNGSIATQDPVGKVDGNAEAVGTVSGNITGTSTAGIVPRQTPGANVFDYYITMGTMIDSTNLEKGDDLEMKKVVLSPSSNPYGNTNPEGIYVIDCDGKEIKIKEMRVLGTLVLLNLASTSHIEKEVLFEPAVVNFPSLLVEGDIQFDYDSTKELDEGGENYNPVGTPYLGEEDSDTSDKYPNVIRGLVYVSGTLTKILSDKPSNVEGVVICGAYSPWGTVNFKYQSVFLDYPPPGFATGSEMEILPGTWTRIASP